MALDVRNIVSPDVARLRKSTSKNSVVKPDQIAKRDSDVKL